jgi:hypothetical protein
MIDTNHKPTTAELLHFHLNINEELPKMVAYEYLETQAPKTQEHHWDALTKFCLEQGMKGFTPKKHEKFWKKIYPNQKEVSVNLDTKNALCAYRWLSSNFPTDFDEFPVWL